MRARRAALGRIAGMTLAAAAGKGVGRSVARVRRGRRCLGLDRSFGGAESGGHVERRLGRAQLPGSGMRLLQMLRAEEI